jgi:hypothetical protein
VNFQETEWNVVGWIRLTWNRIVVGSFDFSNEILGL